MLELRRGDIVLTEVHILSHARDPLATRSEMRTQKFRSLVASLKYFAKGSASGDGRSALDCLIRRSTVDGVLAVTRLRFACSRDDERVS